MVEAVLDSFFCPDIFGVLTMYFTWRFELYLLQRVCHGVLYEMKVIFPVGKSFIFAQLVKAAWKDLEVFGQLNNVNLKPINILLQSRLRKIFSTLNKLREQHLFSVEGSCLTFSSVKSQSPCWTLQHSFQEEM